MGEKTVESVEKTFESINQSPEWMIVYGQRRVWVRTRSRSPQECRHFVLGPVFCRTVNHISFLTRLLSLSLFKFVILNGCLNEYLNQGHGYRSSGDRAVRFLREVCGPGGHHRTISHRGRVGCASCSKFGWVQHRAHSTHTLQTERWPLGKGGQPRHWKVSKKRHLVEWGAKYETCLFLSYLL